MIGVYTVPIPAFVSDKVSLGYCITGEKPREPVSFALFTVHTELSISLSVFTPRPQPAIVSLIYPFKEPLPVGFH